MTQEQQKINRVEELSHFPYKSFQEFKIGIIEGGARPYVDRRIALSWAQDGIHASKSLFAQTVFWSWLPFVAALGFIVWVFVTRSWFMLLGVPFLGIAFVISHPSVTMVIPDIVRSAFIGLAFVCLVYAFLTSKLGLLALCITIVVIWYAIDILYIIVDSELRKAVCEYEDLLCILWREKSLAVVFPNGNCYKVNYFAAHWGMMSDQDVYYDEK